MRHAYLIMAHNNFEQLQILISLLDSEHNDFFVHIDKKVVSFNEKSLETKKSKIYVFKEVNVWWGTYSQVECEFLLLKKAIEGRYDYYHLISGQDMPIKQATKIYDFFLINNGKEFISLCPDALKQNPEIARRAKYYHFFTKLRHCHQSRFLNNIYKMVDRLCLLIQIVLGIDRGKNDNYIIYYGGNWFSITHELAEYVISKELFVKTRFQFVNSADELFLQTIVGNSPYIKKCYTYNGKYDNLRYVEFSSINSKIKKYCGRCHPMLIEKDSIDILIKSQCLFARKFDIKIHPDSIENLRNRLKG